LLFVADMRFDFNVVTASPRQQPVEPGISAAMELVAWADHLVFVFPTWWGTMPAALKGFLDRVFMPGFAFEDREDGKGWDKLLEGKSAHLITTMDTPQLVYRWIYGAPGLNALERATLGFCGIRPVRRLIFGPIKDSDAARRTAWLAEAHAAGLALRHGVATPAQKLWDWVTPWLKALRLQFYPMSAAAYGLGAAMAARQTGDFALRPFWIGLASLVTLKAATVFVNELVDYESDCRNTHAGIFTGGSRVLVEGKIGRKAMRAGVAAMLVLFFVTIMALWPQTRSVACFVLLGVLSVLAIGYTAPPLKLCWRGLGELDVGVTHSFLVVLFGFSVQGVSPGTLLPWLVSIPMFLAILPAITLSGIPDHDADRAAGKRTLSVIFGPRAATRIAEVTAVLAAAFAIWADMTGALSKAFGGITVFTLTHATVLTILLERHIDHRLAPGRIDGLMVSSLLYILWFVAFPLWHFIGGTS
jgi:1,4-dihydroxy-2-naphthoate polyprenyltransferase